MKLGIIGFGVVGQALYDYYKPDHELYTYDIKTDMDSAMDTINENAEVVFICVSTPYSRKGRGLDCTHVYTAVSRITGNKTIIIKSTVMPGTTDSLQEIYLNHRFFFVPEFLNEDTATEDFANPRRPHVVGVTGEGAHLEFNRLESLLPHYDGEECDWIWLPAKQAELLKLATNTFYALKVTFANQMYELGLEQQTLDALGTDSWIYPYHLKVEHKGYRGYGGYCLTKDARAMNEYAKSMHPDQWKQLLLLTNTMDVYNTALVGKQGVDEREFLGWNKQEERIKHPIDQV